MPPRDSPETTNDDSTVGGEDSTDPRKPEPVDGDESIEVGEQSELVGPEIDADPFGDTQAYLVEVAEASVREPSVVGDEVGTLLSILREHDGDRAEDADLILAQIGNRRPAEFEVWARDLADLAGDADLSLAFVGMRSLAQLASQCPDAASVGIDQAMAAANSTDPDLRSAAITIIAEVGAENPEAVTGADTVISSALRDDNHDVCVAGAIAAGKLAGADPTAFPRTINALPERLDDPDERVDTYVHVALAHLASEHPSHLPERQRVLTTLATTTDRELGLREGATGEALAAVIEQGTFE